MTTSNFDGKAYQARLDALHAEGADLHGEARFVRRFLPTSVLDAGCGTGRVAIELARHGVETTGVEMNGSMIAEARRIAPDLEWIEADLTSLHLSRGFDVVVLAGNVPIFCPVDRRPALVRSCAEHLCRGGVLIAGFQLDRDYGLDDYDRCCRVADLTLIERWATWDRDDFAEGGTYAVSVHRRDSAPGERLEGSDMTGRPGAAID